MLLIFKIFQIYQNFNFNNYFYFKPQIKISDINLNLTFFFFMNYFCKLFKNSEFLFYFMIVVYY